MYEYINERIYTYYVRITKTTRYYSEGKSLKSRQKSLNGPVDE